MRFTKTVKESKGEKKSWKNQKETMNWSIEMSEGERWSEQKEQMEKNYLRWFYGLYSQSLMVCYCLSSGVNEVSKPFNCRAN